MQEAHLKRVNAVLFVAICVVLLYVITAPLLPAAIFWLQTHATGYVGQLSNQLRLPVASIPALPQDNRLVIPAMLLDTPIHEGRDLSALHGGGTWRRPSTSTPDEGGNTVIVAHRFTYTNPRGTFYFLDKLHAGDEIGVFWEGRRHLYIVTETKVVPPTDTTVEARTTASQLTLYTCAPLWLPKNRLIVIAREKQPQEKKSNTHALRSPQTNLERKS